MKRLLLILCIFPYGLIAEHEHNFYFIKQALYNFGMGYEYSYGRDWNVGIDLFYPLDMNKAPRSGLVFYNINSNNILIYQKVERSRFLSPDIRFKIKKNLYTFDQGSYLYGGIYYQFYSQLKKEINQITLSFSDINTKYESLTIPPLSYTLFYPNVQEYGLLLGYYKTFRNKIFFSIYIDYIYERKDVFPNKIVNFPRWENFYYNSNFFQYTFEHFIWQSMLLKNYSRFDIKRNGTNGLGLMFGVSF